MESKAVSTWIKSDPVFLRTNDLNVASVIFFCAIMLGVYLWRVPRVVAGVEVPSM
jgi:hypothetical protein